MNAIGSRFGDHSALRAYLSSDDHLAGLDVAMDDVCLSISGAGQLHMQEQLGSGHTDIRRSGDGSISDVYTPNGGHVDVRYSSGKVSDVYYNNQHADLRWSDGLLSDMYLNGNHLDMRYSSGRVSDIYTNGGHLDIRADSQGHITDTYGGCKDLDVITSF